jgi:hypothetical protein
MQNPLSTDRYARVTEISRRVHWDIDRDVIRGRRFDPSRTFLPSGLSLANELTFLSAADKRLLSHVQGRSYAFIFGLVERFIGAKVMEISHKQSLGDPTVLEALVRMTDEELKHQELFRRLEAIMQADMPPGYTPAVAPNEFARSVLGKSTWAVLALTLDIELFTQAHYRASIRPQDDLCPLWKDVFLFHWKEESQHAVLDELELVREDARLTPPQRDQAVGDFIELVMAFDSMLQAQAAADAKYFNAIATGRYTAEQREAVAACFLKAYRWQHIVSGAMEPRFQRILFCLMDDTQSRRVHYALAPLTYAVPDRAEFELPMAA